MCNNFGNWETKDDGEIVYKGTAIASPKTIPVSDLPIMTNLSHMLSKFQTDGCEDGVNFYFAYLTALRNAGYKELTIDLSNIHKISVK
mgnify:FL=1